MFYQVGFLCGHILNDDEPECSPCVPIVFPNPHQHPENISCPECDLSIHMEFLLPAVGDSVKIDLPVKAARNLCDRVLGSDEYEPLEPDNEDDPTLFSYRTSVHAKPTSATMKQRLSVCEEESDTYSFRIQNTFRRGIPFQTMENKKVDVIFLEEQLLDYCKQIKFLLDCLDRELNDTDESEVSSDDSSYESY